MSSNYLDDDLAATAAGETLPGGEQAVDGEEEDDGMTLSAGGPTSNLLMGETLDFNADTGTAGGEGRAHRRRNASRARPAATRRRSASRHTGVHEGVSGGLDRTQGEEDEEELGSSRTASARERITSTMLSTDAGAATAPEAPLINFEEDVIMQRQFGEESGVEKGRRIRDLTFAFKRDLEGIPAVGRELDVLQNLSAALVNGVLALPPWGLDAPLQQSGAAEDAAAEDGDAYMTGSHAAAQQRLLLPLSLLLNVSDASFYDHPLVASPCLALPALEAAVQEIWRERGALGPAPRVGLLGWLGQDHVTPRGLNSRRVNHLVCVEGVVNRITGVQPRLCRAVYVSELAHGGSAAAAGVGGGAAAAAGGRAAGGGVGHGGAAAAGAAGGGVDVGAAASRLLSQQAAAAAGLDDGRQVYVRAFYDVTNLDKDIRDTQPPPERDPTGMRLNRQELGFCYFKNTQRFFLQEAPETAPTGQLPRSVEVLVDEDLCDRVKCGDRVRVWGVYRPRAGGAVNGVGSGLVRPFLIANNVQILTLAARASLLRSLPVDRMNLRLFAGRADLLQLLGRSFAPSICGQDIVKRGLLLQVVGGETRTTQSHHRIRGDIHVLLAGDPSAGKSQLLRFVLQLLPGSVSATGRGSSGVGLTAAVVADAETGERRVEGGATVMADRSIVCIDEFDKMLPGDCVAIHEVMEQQTVTIAKAGVHTTLNARCSVLAAANPLYGCWADDLDARQQLTFEDSLLSRFDLIFILRDSSTPEEDERLAEAVLRNVTEKAKPVDRAGAAGDRGDATAAADCCQVQPQRDMTQLPERHPAAAALLGAGDMEDPAAAADEEGGAAAAGEDEDLLLHGRGSRGGKGSSNSSSRGSATSQQQNPSKIFCPRHKMAYLDKAGREHEVLTTDFLKRYVQYVRRCRYMEDEEEEDGEEGENETGGSGDTGGQQQQREKMKLHGGGSGGGGPQLTDAAAQAIIHFYGEIRERCSSSKSTLGAGGGAAAAGSSSINGMALLRPVTARTLEAVLRLATAHAKLRMHKTITPEDVRVATNLMLFTLFGEEPDEDDDEEWEENGEEKSSSSSDSSSDSSDTGDSSSDEEYRAPRSSSSKQRRRRRQPPSASSTLSPGRKDTTSSSSSSSSRASKRQRNRPRGGAAPDDDTAQDGDLSSRMESLDISTRGAAEAPKKKKRTRQQQQQQGAEEGREGGAAAAAARRGRAAADGVADLEELHRQARRKDKLHQWIIASLKAEDEGSGVEVKRLLQLVRERAAAEGGEGDGGCTEEELDEALRYLDARDAAPLLYHGSKVYEC